jgi:AAA+ superfamily predicted ATPase
VHKIKDLCAGKDNSEWIKSSRTLSEIFGKEIKEGKMKGNEELIAGIKAGYSYFYISSQEVNKTTNDVISYLDAYYKANKNGLEYKVASWDFESTNQAGESAFNNPDDLFKMLEDMQDGVDSVKPGTIIVAKNFNWFLSDEYNNFDKAKVSWLLNRSLKFSSPDYRKVLIIVGDQPFQKAIPDILKRDFARVEFSLPDEKEIEEIYNFIIDSAKENNKFVMPTEQEKKRIIAGAKGLTNNEIIKVFSYSIVKNKGIFDPKTVEDLRAEEINTTPGLKIGKYNKKLADLKGYDVAKEIIEEWIDDPEARGILVLGPAGTGKTHFAQSIAGEFDRLCIEMEFAGMMGGGLVGQAEAAKMRALEVIAANANPNAPIVVLIDEIEKGLAGTSGAGCQGGTNYSGTTDRSNSLFLKFLSDARPKGIYIIATCNDIEKLPAAYVRAERWDTAPLFVDLPNKGEREAILAHYQKEFSIVAKPANMDGWTGAEIKAWCKLAAKKISKGKKASDADELIVPISKTMSKEIDYLRQWKEGRTVPATRKQVVINKEADKRSLNI